MSLISTHKCKRNGKTVTVRYFTTVLEPEEQSGYETDTADEKDVMNMIDSYPGLMEEPKELDVPQPVIEYLYEVQQSSYHDEVMPDFTPEALALTKGCPIDLLKLAEYVGVWADIDGIGGGNAGLFLPLFKATYSNVPSLKSLAATVVKQEEELEGLDAGQIGKKIPISLAREMGLTKK